MDQGSGLSPFADLTLNKANTPPTVARLLPSRKLSWSVESASSTPRRESSNRSSSPYRLKLSGRGSLMRLMNSAPSPTTLSIAEATGKENAFTLPRSPGKLRLPLEDQDTNSQDSGCSEEANSGIRFAIPSGLPPRKNIDPSPSKSWLDDASSPSSSQRSLVFSSPSSTRSNSFRSLSFCSTDSFDDGFSELSELITDKVDENTPSSLGSLLTGQIIRRRENEKSDEGTPTSTRPQIRRAFSMVENQISNTNNANDAKLTYKRPRELGVGGCLIKRRKACGLQKEAPRHKLQRCNSEHATAPTMLSSTLNNLYSRPDLIADFSCTYALPFVAGRHADLTSISPATLAAVINGEYKDTVRSYTIIDCRYPYEFEAGHIRGAINLYTYDQVESTLLGTTPLQPTSEQGVASGRHILIFHCEFSLARGPSLYRYLRRMDRNSSNYPSLQYPEVYLLHKGYKNFYESFSTLCEPAGYRPMDEPGFESDLRKFRAKSSSWSTSRSRLH